MPGIEKPPKDTSSKEPVGFGAIHGRRQQEIINFQEKPVSDEDEGNIGIGKEDQTPVSGSKTAHLAGQTDLAPVSEILSEEMIQTEIYAAIRQLLHEAATNKDDDVRGLFTKSYRAVQELQAKGSLDDKRRFADGMQLGQEYAGIIAGDIIYFTDGTSYQIESIDRDTETLQIRDIQSPGDGDNAYHISFSDVLVDHQTIDRISKIGQKKNSEVSSLTPEVPAAKGMSELAAPAEKIPRTARQLEVLGLSLDSQEVKGMQKTFRGTMDDARGELGSERYRYALIAAQQLAHMKRLGLQLKNTEMWNTLYGFANEIIFNADITNSNKLRYLTYLKASNEELFAENIKDGDLEKLRQEAQEKIFSAPDSFDKINLAQVCTELKYLGIQDTFDKNVADYLLNKTTREAKLLKEGSQISPTAYVRSVARLRYLNIQSENQEKNTFLDQSARQVARQGIKTCHAQGQWQGFARLSLIYRQFFDGKINSDSVKDKLVDKIADAKKGDFALKNTLTSYCADVADLLTNKKEIAPVILESGKTEKVPEPATSPAVPEKASVSMTEPIPAVVTSEERAESMKKEQEKVARESRFIKNIIQGKIVLGDSLLERVEDSQPLTDAGAEKRRQNCIMDMANQIKDIHGRRKLNFLEPFEARAQVVGYLKALFRPSLAKKEVQAARQHTAKSILAIAEGIKNEERKERYMALYRALQSSK